MLEQVRLQFLRSQLKLICPITTTENTLEETKEVIKNLKPGKAPDCDSSITAEAINNGGLFIQETIQKISNRQWTTNIIISLPKMDGWSLFNDQLSRYKFDGNCC